MPSGSFWKKEIKWTRGKLAVLFCALFLLSGIAGGIFSNFIFPHLSGVPFLNLIDPRSPLVINRTEQVVINDGMNTREVYDRLKAVTVTVASYPSTFNFSERQFVPPTVGAGLIATADGLIITTKSVVGAPKNKIRVFLSDKTSFDATLAALDGKSDLALIKISKDNLPVPQFALPEELIAGDRLISIGANFSESDPPMLQTQLVSLPSLSYPYPNYHSSETNDEYLSVNAPYAQNSEGASLANRQSRIAGIFTKSGILTGHYLQAVLTNYLSTRALFWPSLGLNYMVLSSAESLLLGLPAKEGMLVVSRPGVPAVSLSGAAARAGIREGDFIYRVNNGDFSAVKNSLNRVLSTSKPGDQIEMVFWRAGVEQTIKATLKSLP